MSPKNLIRSVVCLSLVLLLLFTTQVEAQQFKVSVYTGKPSFNLGQQASIYGDLVLGGNPVTDGQVAVQITNSEGVITVLRTMPTGQTVLPPFQVEVLEVYPSDSLGNPKSSFGRGTLAFFAVRVRNNNEIEERNVTISVNVYYPTGAPFDCSYISVTIWQNTTFTYVMPSIPIPSDAPTGTAKVYANVFTALISAGGHAYSPEKNATFSITGGGGGNTNTSTFLQLLVTEGSYELVFLMPSTEVPVGTYTAYVYSYYQGHDAANQTTFQVTLLGDINHDAKVDMKDIGIVVKAFGSTPGSPNWNPNADIILDGKVDMKDVGQTVADFGKTCIY